MKRGVSVSGPVVLALAVFLLLAPAFGPAVAQPKFVKNLGNAAEKAAKDLANEAAALLAAGVQLGLVCSRGDGYLKNGQYDQAIQEYTGVARNLPVFPRDAGRFPWLTATSASYMASEVMMKRGDAYSGKGDYASAMADYSEAMKYKPNSAKANKALEEARQKNVQAAAPPPPPPAPTYTLTVNQNPAGGGTVSPSSQKSAPEKTPVNITAVPAAEYKFVNWTVSGGQAWFADANVPNTTVLLGSNATVTANFQQLVKYTLTVSPAQEAGGAVAPAAPVSVITGTPAKISAHPASGYRFVNWTVVSGQAQIANAQSESTTVAPASDATVAANFQLIPTYSLTVSGQPRAGGTVTPDKVQSAPEKTPVKISAAPANGYRFVNWTAASGEAQFANADSASTTVTLTSNAAIAANFQQIPTYSLTIAREPRAGGAVNPERMQGAPEKTPLNISAVPASGYRFVNWTTTSGKVLFASVDSAATKIILSSNAAVTANFQQIPTYSLALSRLPATGGAVAPAAPLTVPEKTSVGISAAPASGYTFINWAVVSGQAKIANADSANTTVILYSNATIAANFLSNDSLYTLTTIHSPTEGGNAAPPSQRNIMARKPVAIVARAAAGYNFVNWTVVSGQAQFANPNNTATAVTLSSNAVIRANFQQSFSLKVNKVPASGGNVSPMSQGDIVGRAPVNIKATAAAANGYKFVNWTVTGGNAWFADANDPNTTVILASDATIAANFHHTPTYTLTVNQNPTSGGSVNPTSQPSVSAGWPVDITAAPVSGYRFVNWTVTSGQAWFDNANNSRTMVSLGSDATVTANFQKGAGGTGDKSSTVLATFGLGRQTLDYSRIKDDDRIYIRDPDRTAESGTTMSLHIMLIGKTGFTLSTGTDLITGGKDGINIDPVLGVGYVHYKTYYVGTILNLIAKPYVLYEYVNDHNYERGDVFIAPTFIAGYDYGHLSMGGQFSYMHGPSSSISGFRFSADIGVKITK